MRRLAVVYGNRAEECLLMFFFQAEDGIREADVTGVQTCALPIFKKEFELDCPSLPKSCSIKMEPVARKIVLDNISQIYNNLPRLRQMVESYPLVSTKPFTLATSEERRVGKECRCQEMAYHQKKKI